MKNYSFTKMNGAGNDFIILEKSSLNKNLTEKDIKFLCDRRLGIGADGLIIIDKSVNYDFSMEYFNADGKEGSLCGNGARCSVKYAYDKKYFTEKIAHFNIKDEEFKGEIINENEICFYMNPPKDIKDKFYVEADGRKIPVYFIDNGSPHVIINIEELSIDADKANEFYDDINQIPVYKLGKEIRYLNDFYPGGANVNFIKKDSDKILIRTYERGVESETLSCGTGAAASALIAFKIFEVNPPIKFFTKGQDNLIVNFKYEYNKFLDISLTGPVKLNYNGNILF